MGFPAHCGYLASRIPWPFALPVPWSPGRDLVWWTLPVGVAVVLTRWMIWVIGVELAEPLENRPTHTPMTSLSEKIEGGCADRSGKPPCRWSTRWTAAS